ncbi:hypothetical protein [Streptomyces sp. UNOC14_S4]|uniref:hypothetical protein n=1 Tax=Streptomyces sp. UNOC14_S4 TaxID=2872340 RepID=UPI001E469CA2|nr:hypothetical protein [Streptomyces sp. UNOC14_S4]MCC3770750.1 hypothetical protein [Streptomyces sp. UNOC14_S4]
MVAHPLVVRPAAYRQFAGTEEPSQGKRAFCLVTDAAVADGFVIEGPHGYAEARIVAARPEDTLQSLLTTRVPEAADLLVVRPGAFVTSPDPAAVGARRISVMPCGSTPVEEGHLRYFLSVLERTDPDAQAARADRFLAGLEQAATDGGLRIVDTAQGTSCAVGLDGPELEVNLQAGRLGPGEQQIAPSGEISILPRPITDFDPACRLALDGELTLRGWPIVHAGYDPALDGPQDDLFRQLLPLHRHPVVVTVVAGSVTACRPGTDHPAAAGAAKALDALLDADERYRTVWELGFGIHTDMAAVPANCGLNEVYGAVDGAVHLGLGLTPFTRFALTFLCPGSAVVDGTGAVLLGASATTRRLRRTNRAGCGCH